MAPRPVLRRWHVALAIALIVPSLVGWHYARQGWRDRHHNYPATPTGYSQIVNRFGEPCNSDARAIPMVWIGADDGAAWTIRFHRKLGGSPTEMVSDKGGRSTNLDNDVHGHIQNDHLASYVKGGVFGYLCRYIDGTTKWSTHAWGIAVDISARFEHLGTCSSVTNKHFAHIFKNHGWRWGLDFCDPMHFQYAFGY